MYTKFLPLPFSLFSSGSDTDIVYDVHYITDEYNSTDDIY